MPIRRASDALPRRPPAPRSQKRIPWRKVGLACLVLLLVAAVAAGLWIRPWVVGPPADPAEIDATWAQVKLWGEPGAESGSDPALLLRALATLEPSQELVEQALDDPEEDALLRAPPEHALLAAQLLVDWADQGGGLGDDPCLGGTEPTFSAIDTLWLGRTAIALSTGVDDARLVAALRLGAQLRDRGGLIHFAVGMAIADDALERVTRRGFDTRSLRAHRPTADPVFPALARDATCFGDDAKETVVDPRSRLGPDAPLPARLATMEREFAMLRWWHGVRLTEAHEVRSDLEALAATLEVEDRDALPRSALVRLVGPSGLPDIIRRAKATIERYDDLLAGG